MQRNYPEKLDGERDESKMFEYLAEAYESFMAGDDDRCQALQEQMESCIG